MFPAGTVPDGSVLLPHHYTWGMIGVVIGFLVIWDDYRHREPVVVALATAAGLFGFLFIWPAYPVVGALISLVAPLAIVGGAFYRLLFQTVVVKFTGLGEDLYPWYWILFIIVFALVALDDAVEHAFHVWTPLDWAFNEHLRPMLPST